MMNSFASVVGGALVGGFVYLATNPLFPETPFLTVNSLFYSDDHVFVERTIPGPLVVADWRVTVVGKDAASPFCQTTPGPNMHEGWSAYHPSPKSITDMSLDVWVGDPGCNARLTPGDYTMFITWTPRDGRAPVVHVSTFTKE